MKNLFLILLTAVFLSCEKDPDTPEALPTVETVHTYTYKVGCYCFESPDNVSYKVTYLAENKQLKDTLIIGGSQTPKFIHRIITDKPVEVMQMLCVLQNTNKVTYVTGELWMDDTCISSATGVLSGSGKPYDVFSLAYKF